MPKYFKKGSFGMMIEVDGGLSDADEVRMPAKEYRGLLDKIRGLEEKARMAEGRANVRVHDAEMKSLSEIETVKKEFEQRSSAQAEKAEVEAADYRKRIDDLSEELQNAEDALRAERGLHDNLIRIMRERANQQRSISPKKAHDGYIVLESREWVEHFTRKVWKTPVDETKEYTDEELRYYVKRGDLVMQRETAHVWKSVLQTPYDASLPQSTIRNRIDDEIWYTGVLADIGCENMSLDSYNGEYQEFINENGFEENGLYRWLYKANYRTGLWEIEIYTTQALTVPENRRPPRRMKKGKKKEEGVKFVTLEDAAREGGDAYAECSD